MYSNPNLVRLPESGCNLPLVFPQVDNLLLDHKVLRIPRQEVFELLDVLSGDVSDLRGRLGPVAEETLDGNLCASSVLPEMNGFLSRVEHYHIPELILEVFNSFYGVVPVSGRAVIVSALDLNKRKCEKKYKNANSVAFSFQ